MRLSRAVAAAAGTLAILKLFPRGYDLRNRVVLITGGSRGLGLLLARRFGAAGAKLAICARDEQELTRAHEELQGKGYNVFAMLCDVGDVDEARQFVEQTAAHYGHLDVVVNNAGIIQVGPVESMSLQDFQEAMDVIFWGSVQTTLAAVPYLKKVEGGRVVNIASIGGAIAVPHLLPYCAAKFAEVGFSTGLRAELAKDGICVTTVLPGLMRTGSFLNAFVKGQRELETQWFSVGASLPIISMSAERAASQIVRACVRGDAFITLGLPFKLARVASVLAPNMVAPLLSLVGRMLPKAPPADVSRPATPARQHRRGVAASAVVILGERAADANNERVPRPDQLH